MCANHASPTGHCDLPPLDAERIDKAVVAYLDGLFIDFEAWQREIAQARDTRSETLEGELDAQRRRLRQTVKREGLLRERWLAAIERGDEAGERQAAEVHREILEERDDAEAAVKRLEVEVKAEPVESDTDAMLDFWNDLRDDLHHGGKSLGDLNERLRAKFEEFRIDQMEDGVIGVQPVLKARPFDWAAAYREWIEAGKPEPTEEQIEVERRERLAEETLWVTGEETIRPPAKAFTVVTGGRSVTRSGSGR